MIHFKEIWVLFLWHFDFFYHCSFNVHGRSCTRRWFTSQVSSPNKKLTINTERGRIKQFKIKTQSYSEAPLWPHAGGWELSRCCLDYLSLHPFVWERIVSRFNLFSQILWLKFWMKKICNNILAFIERGHKAKDSAVVEAVLLVLRVWWF